MATVEPIKYISVEGTLISGYGARVAALLPAWAKEFFHKAAAKLGLNLQAKRYCLCEESLV